MQLARQQVHSAGNRTKTSMSLLTTCQHYRCLTDLKIKTCTQAECLDSLEYLARMNSVVIALDPTYEGDICKAMARDQAKLGAINGTPSFTPIPKKVS